MDIEHWLCKKLCGVRIFEYLLELQTLQDLEEGTWTEWELFYNGFLGRNLDEVRTVRE